MDAPEIMTQATDEGLAEAAREQLARIEACATVHDVAMQHGGTIRWRSFGRGEPLALLHGGHGDWTHWIGNVLPWSAERCVWTVDLPGYGGSSDLPAGSGVDAIVEAVEESLAQLIGRDTPFDLGAFSFGAVSATRIAVRKPLARRLVLVGSAGHGSPRRPRAPLQKWRALEEPARRAAMRHNLGAHMVSDERAIDRLALEAYVGSVTATRFRSKGISRNSSIGATLSGFQRPVLFIWGEHDVTATPALLTEPLTRGFPQRKLAIVPGAGHWAQYEAAPAVNALVSEWLAHASATTTPPD